MADRLQKIISASGLMSRRAAENCISEGRVVLNGRTAVLGDRADPHSDLILLDGRPLPSGAEKQYIMLNKPKGYVCTLNDEKDRKNVCELVESANTRLYPVGRLDMYSEGLLIMTNDGNFANILMHPSHNFKKTYRTWAEGRDVGAAVEYLRCPLELDDGYVVQAENVEIERVYPGGAVLLITIAEGRNRQVRKMCGICGLKVSRLMRIKEGPLELGDLPEGKWRRLSDDEVKAIVAANKH
ncbi:MAG: pseudouridine synthase [Candidatus Limivicinus sp.]|jgi:23S rRNA pseudouridine2605 synthase